ncbi:MAG: hypothetical protein KKB24_03875, partial [Candidatus Altiarchaeota archaeon]|nr:hypothetical protein [Candidatus Altiarchaeota archaeon]
RVVFALEVKKMNAKSELEGCYLRHHPSERELDRYEREYLECCLIPEMEGRYYKKLGTTWKHKHFSSALPQPL